MQGPVSGCLLGMDLGSSSETNPGCVIVDVRFPRPTEEPVQLMEQPPFVQGSSLTDGMAAV